MSTPNQALSRIPPELMDGTIDLLHDDFSSLGVLALACKAFLPRTQMHRFKEIRVYLRQDSEDRWKKLHQLMDKTPSESLRNCVKKITIMGEQYHYDTWAVLGPEVLGITPTAFPKLSELTMLNVTLPSVEHLAALILSLPSLEKLRCDCVTYADPAQAHAPKNPRWYSGPLTLATPSPVPGCTLKKLDLYDATWIDGEPLKAATNLVTCLMEASVHAAVENLNLLVRNHRWHAPSWVPLVRACAHNLYMLTITFGPRDMEPAAAAPPFFDALRELPRLRILKIHYEAMPSESADSESDNGFVPVFVLGTLKLVRQTPVPFPQLEYFQLFYGRSSIPDAEQPLFYPEGTEDGLHEILRGFLAERWVAKGVPGQRRYPCLKCFGFCVLAPQRLREAHKDELERLKKDLLETSGKSSVRAEVFSEGR